MDSHDPSDTPTGHKPPLMQRLRRLPWRRFAVGAGVLASAAAIGGIAYGVALLKVSPDVQEIRRAQAARPTVLMSADGKVLSSIGRSQQDYVPLSEISPHVVKALLSTEDHRFYSHHGVDFYRTLGAVFHTATGDTQGGSTLTQQLARNLFPEDIGRSRSLHRKFKEMVTAFRIERIYSKQQILEIYLNTTPFLYNTSGIEMAARTYWNKPALELDALQAATLVGMLKGPSYYNPVSQPERTRKRRNVVLAQMVKHDQMAPRQYALLAKAPVKVTLNRPNDALGAAPHFTAFARKWLAEWATRNHRDLYAEGLVVETTIDSRLQAAATLAVEKQAAMLQQVADVEWAQASAGGWNNPEGYAQRRAKVQPFAYFWKQNPTLLKTWVRESPDFRAAVKQGTSEQQAFKDLMADGEWLARLKDQKTRLEAGFVAMDPSTGEVKAWVGSRDFNLEQYDHVAQAERQPGSTFKPFVYGAALEAGFTPEHGYIDHAVEIKSPDGSAWRPTDMAGASDAPMSLREGLIFSKNSITAQVMQDVGVSRVMTLAQAAGVNKSHLDAVPSLALGTSPVTLLEMVNGYATIAQEGQRHEPLVVKRILDRDGRVIAEFGSSPQRAMSPDSALQLVDMMRGVVSQGTGTMVKTRFGLNGDVAGKTGTTQNNADGWFILMHPQLVAGAWVGFNDLRVTMRSNYWGQGGHNAVMLVGDFFRTSLQSKLVDAKATFAAPRRPLGQVITAGWRDPGDTDPPQDENAQRRNDFIDESPKTSDELERAFADKPSNVQARPVPVPLFMQAPSMSN